MLARLLVNLSGGIWRVRVKFQNISDDCLIYSCVKIIGNNVILEANVVINRDIEDNSQISIFSV